MQGQSESLVSPPAVSAAPVASGDRFIVQSGATIAGNTDVNRGKDF
jgi:hypothetical protein